MKRYIGFALCIWFVVSCKSPAHERTSTIATISSVESTLRPQLILATDSTWSIAERMRHYGVPGVSIAVIKDHQIHWSKSYGVINRDTKEPVTNKTLFQAGSISKPVAAYGALKMVEMGAIKKEENVNNFLTSWTLPDNEFTDSNKVTLEHLLSHTGGITVHGFLGYNPQEEVPTLTALLDGAAPANSGPIRVDKTPGAGFRYSGGGYCIMQQMVIDQSPESSYPEIMKKLVLDPIGMTSSTYDQPLSSEQLILAATGYLPDGSMTKGKRHTYPEMSAAGLWATAEDLARFAIDLSLSLEGKSNKVLSQSIVQHMVTPFIVDFVGMGIFINKKQDEIYLGHGGWDEGFSSELIFHKDKGYGVVVLTNSNHPDFISELIRSVAQIYQWDEYLPPIYNTLDIADNELERITGRYLQSADNTLEIYSDKDQLFLKSLRDNPVALFKVDEDTYAQREKTELIHIQKDPVAGKLHLVFDSNPGEPQVFEHPKITDDFQVPYEMLLAGNSEEALEAYRKLLADSPSARDIQEGTLNSRGYQLMGSDQLELAIAIFKINTLLYPESFNTYDSLGEAYKKQGNNILAIANYRRSLELNPENQNARKVLEEIADES